jgi:imidazole glycerol-phosphate synthase subunit HisF
MLRPRIIPCLLIHKGGLVKTVKFGSPKYVGDPLNAVRIFNEKEVDELMIIDIDATLCGQVPDEAMIANLAAECRMPLTYGGGVKTVEQIEKLIALGIEKVAISSAAIENPDMIVRAAERVGRQSIVGVIDVITEGLLDNAEVLTHNATKKTGLHPVEFAQRLQKLGVGEIVVNSVNRDGMMQGYDMALVDSISEATDVPLTILGGAGSLNDIRQLIGKYKLVGAAAGSLFVFKGKFRAVLINYPDRIAHEALCGG